MAAAVGIILEKEQVFCGDNIYKKLGYFAGLLELVGIFGMGAFGFGLAVYFSAGKNKTDDAMSLSAYERRDLSSTIAISSIVYLLGAVLSIVELHRKGGGFSISRFLLSHFNAFMCLLLTIFWFLFADVIVDTTDTAKTRTKDYAYVIGIVLLTTGFGGFLKCVGAIRD